MRRLYISEVAETGVVYKASFPTNPRQNLRLWLALRLIHLGLKLTPWNGIVTVTTGTSCPWLIGIGGEGEQLD